MAERLSSCPPPQSQVGLIMQVLLRGFVMALAGRAQVMEVMRPPSAAVCPEVTVSQDFAGSLRWLHTLHFQVSYRCVAVWTGYRCTAACQNVIQAHATGSIRHLSVFCRCIKRKIHDSPTDGDGERGVVSLASQHSCSIAQLPSWIEFKQPPTP